MQGCVGCVCGAEHLLAHVVCSHCRIPAPCDIRAACAAASQLFLTIKPSLHILFSPHQVTEESGNVKIKCPNASKSFAPEEISAQVLRKLCDDSAKFLNDKVDKAVITVPAYFNDSQRQVRQLTGRL